jgi:hypothetical protein
VEKLFNQNWFIQTPISVIFKKSVEVPKSCCTEDPTTGTLHNTTTALPYGSVACSVDRSDEINKVYFRW